MVGPKLIGNFTNVPLKHNLNCLIRERMDKFTGAFFVLKNNLSVDKVLQSYLKLD